MATNVHWNFAPAVSVPQDIRWGRTYEGFSEDPALVSELGAAYIRGLQQSDRPVLASPKHFVGDGGTSWGSTPRYAWLADLWQSADPNRWMIDQGDMRGDETLLRTIHLPPYQAAIAAGARSIMVSYSSWNGLKLHRHHYLLTELLKDELGFSGFLISDWLAVSQLDPNLVHAVTQAINAGLDMVMVPFDYRSFITCTSEAVASGAIPLTRIDDAVRRILRVKYELGLFEQPFGDEQLLAAVGGPEHRLTARAAVSKSLVLLRNERRTLPLDRAIPQLLLAGPAADDIGAQCGGWTIEWQGGRGAITPGTTLLAALQQGAAPATVITYAPDGVLAPDTHAPVAIVVLAEPPYTEGEGDRADLGLASEDIALVERVRPHCTHLVVVLYSGRPLLIDALLPLCDAVIAAWLPGTEAGGIADVLFGEQPVSGRLPYTWPRDMRQVPLAQMQGEPRFPRGYGLSYETDLPT